MTTGIGLLLGGWIAYDVALRVATGPRSEDGHRAAASQPNRQGVNFGEQVVQGDVGPTGERLAGQDSFVAVVPLRDKEDQPVVGMELFVHSDGRDHGSFISTADGTLRLELTVPIPRLSIRTAVSPLGEVSLQGESDGELRYSTLRLAACGIVDLEVIGYGPTAATDLTISIIEAGFDGEAVASGKLIAVTNSPGSEAYDLRVLAVPAFSIARVHLIGDGIRCVWPMVLSGLPANGRLRYTIDLRSVPTWKVRIANLPASATPGLLVDARSSADPREPSQAPATRFGLLDAEGILTLRGPLADRLRLEIPTAFRPILVAKPSSETDFSTAADDLGENAPIKEIIGLMVDLTEDELLHPPRFHLHDGESRSQASSSFPNSVLLVDAESLMGPGAVDVQFDDGGRYSIEWSDLQIGPDRIAVIPTPSLRHGSIALRLPRAPLAELLPMVWKVQGDTAERLWNVAYQAEPNGFAIKGLIAGDYRIGLDYRRRWRTVIAEEVRVRESEETTIERQFATPMRFCGRVDRWESSSPSLRPVSLMSENATAAISGDGSFEIYSTDPVRDRFRVEYRSGVTGDSDVVGVEPTQDCNMIVLRCRLGSLAIAALLVEPVLDGSIWVDLGAPSNDPRHMRPPVNRAHSSANGSVEFLVDGEAPWTAIVWEQVGSVHHLRGWFQGRGSGSFDLEAGGRWVDVSPGGMSGVHDVWVHPRESAAGEPVCLGLHDCGSTLHAWIPWDAGALELRSGAARVRRLGLPADSPVALEWPK